MLTPSLSNRALRRLLPSSVTRDARLQSAIDRLFDRVNYERIKPGKYELADFELSRMAALLGELGNPQRATPCVHIAGTKGKGSVASMLATVLSEAGFTTGLFTSPHIHHFEERVKIDGRFADATALLESFDDVWAAVDRLDARDQHATYFEIATALAWDVFRRVECQLAVIEVGLGGRLDSTNICDPLVTVITSISRDHSKLLGDTLGEIAAEKAGIFKQSVPAISGADGEAAATISDIAAERDCDLWTLGVDIRFTPTSAEPLDCRKTDVVTPTNRHADVPVVLPGPHQERNTALVAAICDRLPTELRPDADAITRGLSAAVCPLRIEVMSQRPWIILDAAHNGASIKALMETVRPVNASKRWLIFGTSRDKHVEDMLPEFVDFADHVIVAEYSTNPRALPVDELADLARERLNQPVTVATDPKSAIDGVLDSAGPNDLVVVTGSFFLAGEIREHLIDNHLHANAQAGDHE